MYRAILAVSLLSMAAMVTTVLLVNEDLEDTMLQVEYRQERDFILGHRTPGEVLVWDTQDVAIAFIPHGMARPPGMPEVLRELPDGPYSAEIEGKGLTYLVNVDVMDAGTLYMAKNITHFEKREALFQMALAIMTVIILAVSLLLALLGSRRIVTPLTRLAQQIRRVPAGASMPHIEADYADAELYSIAHTFNRFLDELESYVRREQSLLGLASHELRTPIAVMSGALDIIEVRDQLGENDKATLARVRRACEEMRDNVDVLLKLARRDGGGTSRQHVRLDETVRQVIDDLAVGHDANGRVSLVSAEPVVVFADPTLVAMLLRNLVQNALLHTRGAIQVTLMPGAIEVGDQGAGLSPGQQAILRGEQKMPADGQAFSGLGLYIVTLTCERLGWQLDILRSGGSGTLIRVTTEGS